MSWIAKLYETYEYCADQIGIPKNRGAVLLPVSHTTQQAQIEVTIDGKGNYLKGEVIAEKPERTTIIPCTESSTNRTFGPVPHPLFDKLQYTAGDYKRYGTPKRGVKQPDGGLKDCSEAYLDQLGEWCSSPYAHPKVCAVFRYLQKKTLIADLIADGILFCGEDGRLMKKWTGDKNETPPIFKAVTNDPSDAFVRFKVRIEGDPLDRIWEDQTIWQSFADYQTSLQSQTDICYVRGTAIPCAAMSPAKIRNAVDMAKLISSNDKSGFTARGRFVKAEDAAKIGYETTQKAHNALKWLIQLQGHVSGNQVVLAWGTRGEPTPDPFQNSADMVIKSETSFNTDSFFSPQKPVHSIFTEFADRFNKMIAGYSKNLDDCSEVVVLGLDSATSGRLSITYYRELKGSEYLERIQKWHSSCNWLLRYHFVAAGIDNKGKTVYKRISFTGAPAPEEIAKAAYGDNVSDKLKKAAMERLLPCIVDSRPVPKDFVLCTARRASNPVALSQSEAEKVLNIACALIRKYHNDKQNREVWKMSLDLEIKDRDYLFGRVLAFAEQIESYALREMDVKRNTNALRLRQQYSLRPAKTLGILMGQLTPYIQKLGPDKVGWLKSGMDEVISMIPLDDFTNSPLSEKYLLGYSCQIQQFHEEIQERKQRNEAKKAKEEKQADQEGEME